MTSKDSLSRLSNEALIAETARLAGRERTATAELIAALAEVDARRLYLGEGCSSMYAYCTRVLHLSEHAAYGRIEAARAARRFPEILEMLADGSLALTSIGLLARLLTPHNHREVLEAARHRSGPCHRGHRNLRVERSSSQGSRVKGQGRRANSEGERTRGNMRPLKFLGTSDRPATRRSQTQQQAT